MPDASLLFIPVLIGSRGPAVWRGCAVSCDTGGSSSAGRPVFHETLGRRQRGYWNNPENLTRELRAFAVAQGDPSRMPTEAELRRGGRVDIASAVRRCGGWERSAAVAGLVLSSIARPRSIYLTYCIDLKPGAILKPHRYWNEFDNLRDELMDFVRNADEKSGKAASARSMSSVEGPVMLPSTAQLEQAGRNDLVRAIHKHGGFEAVARRLDLRFRYHSSGYWRNFENVEKEIRLLTSVFNSQMSMPPLQAISRHGPPGLRHAITQIHGGKHIVAERLGLDNKHLPRGYWCSSENREKAVREFVGQLVTSGAKHDPNDLPAKSVMLAAGRAALAQAIERHGGFREHALAYGLRYDGYGGKRRGNRSLCACYVEKAKTLDVTSRSDRSQA